MSIEFFTKKKKKEKRDRLELLESQWGNANHCSVANLFLRKFLSKCWQCFPESTRSSLTAGGRSKQLGNSEPGTCPDACKSLTSSNSHDPFACPLASKQVSSVSLFARSPVLAWFYCLRQQYPWISDAVPFETSRSSLVLALAVTCSWWWSAQVAEIYPFWFGLVYLFFSPFIFQLLHVFPV